MATRTISNSGGNFSSVGSWVEGVVPVAGDAVVATATSGNLTVDVPSAAASMILTGYVGTLTFNSTLTLTSTVTFVSGMTIAGTAGTLILNGTANITSGGKTLTCALTMGTGTFTIQDNWTVNGLYTPAVSTVNGASFKITCAGGVHATGTMPAGTAKLELTGGTWDSASGVLGNNLDLAGNVTVSGAVGWGATGKTLAYVSGTITTAGSTLTVAAAGTLNTAGVTWAGVTLSGAVTYTLSGSLAWSGTLTLSASSTFSGAGALNGTGAVSITNPVTLALSNAGGLVTTGAITLPNAAVTFAGSAGFTVGTLTTASLTASRTYTLTFGNTYRVTAALANVGTTAAIRQALVSGTPGSKVAFTLSPGATVALAYCDPTDVDSSAGATVTSVNGVITSTLNWNNTITTPITPAGGGGRVYHMGI